MKEVKHTGVYIHSQRPSDSLSSCFMTKGRNGKNKSFPLEKLFLLLWKILHYSRCTEYRTKRYHLLPIRLRDQNEWEDQWVQSTEYPYTAGINLCCTTLLEGQFYNLYKKP